jgi:hypothetical protein
MEWVGSPIFRNRRLQSPGHQIANMPGYRYLVGLEAWCHVRCAVVIGPAICVAIIADPSNATWAVYSTCPPS